MEDDQEDTYNQYSYPYLVNNLRKILWNNLKCVLLVLRTPGLSDGLWIL